MTSQTSTSEERSKLLFSSQVNNLIDIKKSEILVIKTRVSDLEVSHSDHAGSIESISNDLDAAEITLGIHTANISGHNVTIASHTNSIGNNTAGIISNTADIVSNTADIAANTADIVTNTADIVANTDDIVSLDARVTTVEGFTIRTVYNLSANPFYDVDVSFSNYSVQPNITIDYYGAVDENLGITGVDLYGDSGVFHRFTGQIHITVDHSTGTKIAGGSATARLLVVIEPILLELSTGYLYDHTTCWDYTNNLDLTPWRRTDSFGYYSITASNVGVTPITYILCFDSVANYLI